MAIEKASRAPGAQRRAHLREYLSACIVDNVLSRADFVSPHLVLAQLGKTFVADLESVVKDYGRERGAHVLNVGADACDRLGQGLKQLASELLGHRSKR